MWDVIVVGSGPGGSIAAKRCAEQGMKVLLLEKRRLPRDKVCSGMQMCRLAQQIVKDEFGETPQDVLVSPFYLKGIMLHVEGTNTRKIEYHMPTAWRRDLDYWMVKKALKTGVELWEETRVLAVEEAETSKLKVKRGRFEQEVAARYIIGADGAGSMIRKSLFPSLEVRYMQCMQQQFEATSTLEKEYFHFFSSPQLAPYYVSVHWKGDVLLVEAGARIGQLKEVMEKARQLLTREHGFKPQARLLQQDGCLEPVLYRELFSGTFSPAKGNVLLVGDAAGLLVPVSGEGIAYALRSGLLAADAVVQAGGKGHGAGAIYVDGLKPMLATFKGIYPRTREIHQKSAEGGAPLMETLVDSWKETLQVEAGGKGNS